VNNCIIGLDIGGTAIKGALFGESGEIAFRNEIATPHDSGQAFFIDTLCDFAAALSDGHTVDAVGLGIAGILDHECTTLLESPGSGLILNSRLWRGEQGRAGEFGHITVYPEGELCGCGKKGCLEAHSSGTAIVRMAAAAAHQHSATALRAYADTPEELNPKIVYQNACAGDAVSRDIFKAMAQGLALAIANVHTLLDLYTFIAGGGVSRAYDYFYPMVMEEIDQRIFSSVRGRIRLLRAELGNDAGVYGAAYAAREVLARV